ncbi:MAG TPA: GNAT family N-acetyltransferase [Gemmatimonadaceae bacterium]|nr:GNAT family N-acetyltransferase [Gemmatimonadaceae bacterium]
MTVLTDVIYRRMRVTDVETVAGLINAYAAERVMLPKTPEAIALASDDFIVATDRAGRILGCGAVREYSPSLAEVASVAVAREAHGMRIGAGIVARVERLAVARGIDEVFALTTTPAFFEHVGYAVVDRAMYPEKIRRDCLSCPRRAACDEICVAKTLQGAQLVAA